MCKFCDLKRPKGTGSYYWGKTGNRIDGFAIDQRVCITEEGVEFDAKKPSLECDCDDFLLELDINYCPMCGRKLGE